MLSDLLKLGIRLQNNSIGEFTQGQNGNVNLVTFTFHVFLEKIGKFGESLPYPVTVLPILPSRQGSLKFRSLCVENVHC